MSASRGTLNACWLASASPHLIEESIDLLAIIAKRSTLGEGALGGLVSFARGMKAQHRFKSRHVSQFRFPAGKCPGEIRNVAVSRVGLDILVCERRIAENPAAGLQEGLDSYCIHFTICYIVLDFPDHAEVLGGVRNEHAVVDVVQAQHL